MTAPMNADSELELFREGLDAMKREVASLIEHMKGVATNTVQNAACEVEGASEASAGKRGPKAAARRTHSISLFTTDHLSH